MTEINSVREFRSNPIITLIFKIFYKLNFENTDWRLFCNGTNGEGLGERLMVKRVPINNIPLNHKTPTQQVSVLTVSNDRSKSRDTHKLINLSLSDGIL